MCKAIDDLVARGEARGKTEALLDLVRDKLLDISVAAERLGKTVEEVKRLIPYRRKQLKIERGIATSAVSLFCVDKMCAGGGVK